MFIFDQTAAAKEAVVDGSLNVQAGGYLGIINAAEGTINLTTENGTVTFEDGAKVATDNPFIVSEVNTDKKTLTNSINVDSGLQALTSLGVQAMARRADFKMAEAVASHTSVDQDLSKPLNLWVEASGERYESDGLRSDGDFKADMGYAVFGGDVAIGDVWTAGAAVQYGTGSLRSTVSSIKNDIDAWGFTLYGTHSSCGGACKVVAELAYTQTKNDIKAAQTALNESVDAKVYSAGIRGQHQFTAGGFAFIPSLGIRISRLESDAMNIGMVRVEDQDFTFVQLPLSLTITGAEKNVDGWTLAPYMKATYAPAFGDKALKVFSHETDVIDMSPVQGEFGLRAQNGNMIFGADFQVGGGDYGTSSIGGKVSFKYAF